MVTDLSDSTESTLTIVVGHPDIYRNLVLNEMINFKGMTCDMRRQAALQRARRRQGSGACIVDVDADDEDGGDVIAEATATR